MSQPLDEFIAFARTLADAAAKETLPRFRAQLDVVNKAPHGAFDPVTQADREAEAAIRACVRQTYPDHGVLGEEQGLTPGTSGYTWVIDPIDGTRSFVSGIPLWTSLIALNHNGRPILGVIDQPYLGERYIGSAKAAVIELRGTARPLRARPVKRLSEATFSTTTPDLFRSAHEKRVIERLVPAVRLVRYGLDCYAYALVAAGLIDVVVEVGLHAWDVQAFIPLIEAAGGAVARWDGGPAPEGGSLVAAASPALLEETLALIASADEATARPQR